MDSTFIGFIRVYQSNPCHPCSIFYLLSSYQPILPKAISCEKYTHLTGLFVRLLRCKNVCPSRLPIPLPFLRHTCRVLRLPIKSPHLYTQVCRNTRACRARLSSKARTARPYRGIVAAPGNETALCITMSCSSKHKPLSHIRLFNPSSKTIS